MPEFILNVRAKGRGKSPAKGYESLNEFAKGYVEAMFFTNGDTGNDKREDHLNELGVARLTRKACVDIARDCAEFEKKGEELLNFAYLTGYEPEKAGRDFWFTRQGHGVGFWNRKELEFDVYHEGAFQGILGALLSKLAKSFGEVYPYVKGGWIYHG